MDANSIFNAALIGKQGVDSTLIRKDYKTWFADAHPKEWADIPHPDVVEWGRLDYIPDTYKEDGVTKIVVFGGDLLPERLTIVDGKVKEELPF